MTDKIAVNIAAALNAIVEQESAKYGQQFDESAARLVVQKEKLKPLLTALEEVKRQVAAFPKIEVNVSPHGHMAWVKVGERRYSISTDLANAKFTTEENYWSESGGRNVEFFNSYESAEDVLRLVMESIGKHIALQRVIEQRRAGSV